MMTIVTIATGFAGYAAVASWVVSIVGNRRIVPTKDRDVRVARENRLSAIVGLERRKRAGENVDAKLQRWLEFDAKMNQMGR